MNRLILFLLRRKFGLKKFEHFYFENQKTDDIYYFGHLGLYKNIDYDVVKSGVSLNWLLDPKCKIIKYNKKYNKNITKTEIITKTEKVKKKSSITKTGYITELKKHFVIVFVIRKSKKRL